MVATKNRDGAAGDGSRRRLRTLRRAIAAFLGNLCAQRQLAANRRLMEELPDHLLEDMGISRTEIGPPAEPPAADILRKAGDWR